MNTRDIHATKPSDFLTRAIEDLSAGYRGVMASPGGKLQLGKAMVDARPIGANELAARSGCAERRARQWLDSQAAGGYGKSNSHGARAFGDRMSGSRRRNSSSGTSTLA